MLAMSNFDLLLLSCEFEPFRPKTLSPNWTQAEGMILGTAAKIFTIAGPVIVYGVSENVVYGLIYWITTVPQRKKRNTQIAKANSLWQSKYLTGI